MKNQKKKFYILHSSFFIIQLNSDVGSNRIENLGDIIIDFSTLEDIKHISTMESAKNFEKLSFEIMYAF